VTPSMAEPSPASFSTNRMFNSGRGWSLLARPSGILYDSAQLLWQNIHTRLGSSYEMSFLVQKEFILFAIL
jgi:hypothetical protein